VTAPAEPAAGSGRPAGSWRPRPVEIVFALTLAAAALRFATLDVQSLWLDESATVVLVHRGFSGMLSHLSSSESAPPLYYVLVWAWTKLFGAGAVGFRSLSALVGTLTVPVLYLAGRRVSERAGVWAAALAACNPAMYYYSQEARCYALLIFFSAVAFVLWQRALAAPDARRLALWAGASILAVLTHYFAAFLFIPEALILARRLGWRRVLAPAGAVVLVGVALLPLAISQHENGRKSEWIEASSLISRIAETAKEFLVGLYGPLEILSAAIAGLLAIGALLLVLRDSDERARPVARDTAIVAATAMLIPLLAALSGALDVFDGRNVIADWVPWAVLLAIGLGAAGARHAGAVLGVGMCAVSLAVIAATNLIPAYQRDDWRGAARALTPLRLGSRVLVSESSSSIPLSVYLPGVQALAAPTVITRELDFIALRVRRTGRSPLAPAPPTSPPSGFRLAGVRRSETYAVSRFVATRPRTLRASALRRMSGESTAEVMLQR
jgi:4-amino-4-deoxy-L-arabinose transferase-like glycosyltransferase